jgi:hypothetical protein
MKNLHHVAAALAMAGCSTVCAATIPPLRASAMPPRRVR